MKDGVGWQQLEVPRPPYNRGCGNSLCDWPYGDCSERSRLNTVRRDINRVKLIAICN